MGDRPQLHILAIAPYSAYPPHGGGKLRVYHLVQEWLELGHAVTLWLCPNDESTVAWEPAHPAPRIVAWPGRPRSGVMVKARSILSLEPEEVWTRPLAASPSDLPSPVDVVVLMQAAVGKYEALFRENTVPVVLDQQNIEHAISMAVSRLAPTAIGRIRARLDVWKWRRYERSLMQRVDRTVAVSDLDAAGFRALDASAIVRVFPSGTAIRSVLAADHTINRRDRLIMTGTLGYLPNLDAADWMIRRILPRIRAVRPNAHLILVGASAPSWLLQPMDGVQVVGRVPEVRPFLDDADLFVAPLRAGGGTRLKLLESFAVGLPVVATTIAAEGLAVEDDRHLAIADDEESFAEAVLRLLDDQVARSAYARAARTLVQDRYDWRTIAAAYATELEDVVARAGAGGHHRAG